MSDIKEYIKKHRKDIAYVARSAMGNWTIALFDRGNYTGGTISSCSRLEDSEIEELKKMGILVFDFEGTETFVSLLHEMEALDKSLRK